MSLDGAYNKVQKWADRQRKATEEVNNEKRLLNLALHPFDIRDHMTLTDLSPSDVCDLQNLRVHRHRLENARAKEALAKQRFDDAVSEYQAVLRAGRVETHVASA